MARNLSKRVGLLTPRQREVVRLVSLGCTMGQTAKILDIALSTADNHRSAAMRLLEVDKAALLTRIAIKSRISSLNDELTPAERRRLRRR